MVAIKLVRKERLANADAVKRFQREIRAAAQLQHPNIVQALDADEMGGINFFVMEYVEGQPLNRVLKERGPFPVEWACDFLARPPSGYSTPTNEA